MLCARKKGMQRNRKKEITQECETEIEKSRYRDEFLIRYSIEKYVYQTIVLPKNSSKLSRLLVTIIFLVF